MRASILTLAAALSMVPSFARAQGPGPWGNVKSWTGSVTIEATQSVKREDGFTSTMSYKATGPVTLTDGALGDGDHVQWPMPNPESLADPAKAGSAFTPWKAHITGTYQAKGVDEGGKPFAITCSADGAELARVFMAINPMDDTYTFQVNAPPIQFKCSKPDGPHPTFNLPQAAFELRGGPRGQPHPVSGEKTFTTGNATIKVSYSMAPAK
jgi:hypothetical protein